MRKLRWLLMALAILLFIVADAQAQGQDGGGRRSRRGGRGGGGWGGGGRGGGWGGGGGRRGGGFSRDPGQSFDRMANGKSVIKRADMQGFMQGFFDRIAKAAGVTNGELTREQWIKGSEAMMSQFRGGRGFGGGGGGDTTKDAEAEFKKLDKNNDGKLNGDEMPKDLASQKDKWDTNKDGLIDLNEYTAYYKSTHQAKGGDQSYGDIPIEIEPEDSKPVVYHAGNVPKDLQPTFQQYDTNGDGQISLYEWRKGGGSMEDFLAMDRNNDGLVTIEEMLFYNANKKANAGGPPGGTFGRTSGYNGGNFGSRRGGRSRRGGFGGGN